MIRPTVWPWRAHCAAADSHGFVLPLHQTCHCGSRSACFHYLTGSAGPLPLPAAICTPTKKKEKRILQQSLRGDLSHAEKHIVQALTVCLVFSNFGAQSSELSSSLRPSAKTHFASLFGFAKVFDLLKNSKSNNSPCSQGHSNDWGKVRNLRAKEGSEHSGGEQRNTHTP